VLLGQKLGGNGDSRKNLAIVVKLVDELIKRVASATPWDSVEMSFETPA
jgi:hypothetical protein